MVDEIKLCPVSPTYGLSEKAILVDGRERNQEDQRNSLTQRGCPDTKQRGEAALSSFAMQM
jgi:hypothetical protein